MFEPACRDVGGFPTILEHVWPVRLIFRSRQGMLRT